MSIGLLGNKIGMTQIFDKKGEVIPVTVIKAGPCCITNLKSKKNCGYSAIQLGYLEIATNKKKVSKSQLTYFKKFHLPVFRYLKEYKTNDIEKYCVGQIITAHIFNVGESVNVTGYTIGKGNTGNIKRHKFHRGSMSHGSKHHRLQGSLGAGTSPGRVFPGKKMPGRVGVEKRTIIGLEILQIHEKENLLVVKGSIPGKAGNLVSINSKS